MKKIGIILLLSSIYGTPMILGMDSAITETKEEHQVAQSPDEAQQAPEAQVEQPAAAQSENATPETIETSKPSSSLFGGLWNRVRSGAATEQSDDEGKLKDKLLLDLTEQLKKETSRADKAEAENTALKLEIASLNAVNAQLQSDIQVLEANQ